MRANRIKSSIPYVGLFLSIVTAVALIWNVREAREHYRRIVKPMVLADVTTGKLNEGWGIFLKNEGTGPAVINYNAVTLDGRRISILDVVPQMIKEGIVSPDSNFSVLDLNAMGSYLKDGAKKTILVFDPKAVVICCNS